MKTPLPAVSAACALLALAAGCAVQPRTAHVPLAARGEISLRASSDRVAVTVIDRAASFNLAEPEDRAGAAGTVARESMIETLRSGGEGAILFPAAFVLGGISGAVFGVDAADAARGAAAVRRAQREAPLEAQIVAALEGALAPQGISLARVADDLPVVAPPQTYRWSAEGQSRPRPVRSARPAHPLRDRDTDILLGVRVVFQGFQRAPRPSGVVVYPVDAINPPLALMFAVSVSALRVTDWSELGGVSVTWTSRPMTFTAWTADDARELRRALARAAQEIRAEIAARIVVSGGRAAEHAPAPSD